MMYTKSFRFDMIKEEVKPRQLKAQRIKLY